MDDFKVLDANPPFAHQVDGDLQRFAFPTVALGPGEGVVVEFAVDIALPPIDVLRKTAVPFVSGQ